MKNPHAIAMGKLGGKASPRKDAWRNMTPEERTENARSASAKRWAGLTEDQRKAQLAKVRAARKPNPRRVP